MYSSQDPPNIIIFFTLMFIEQNPRRDYTKKFYLDYALLAEADQFTVNKSLHQENRERDKTSNSSV